LRLDQIIDFDHALVKLARAIDWRFLKEIFAAADDTISVYRAPLRCTWVVINAGRWAFF
jgi:hypothetical protein